MIFVMQLENQTSNENFQRDKNKCWYEIEMKIVCLVVCY